MIKTWEQRCEEHPSHQSGMVSNTMIQARMQEEIEDLRVALAQPERKPLTEEEIAEISMDCSFVSESDTYFARAIEKAHGIGGVKHE